MEAQDFIPIWGSANLTVKDFKKGDYFGALMNTGFTVFEVFTLGEGVVLTKPEQIAYRTLEKQLISQSRNLAVKEGVHKVGEKLMVPLAEETLSQAIFNGVGAVNQVEKKAIGEVKRVYSARELVRRGIEPGVFHNFPESFNRIIFQNGTRTVFPNYFNVAKNGLSNTSILYKHPGIINGKKGLYEIAVRPSLSGKTEIVMHRFFNHIK